MLTKEDVRDAVNEAIQQHMAIDAEIHAKHHNLLERLIEQQDRRMRFYDRVKQQVAGWGVITMLGAIGYMTYEYFVGVVRKISGH